MTTIRNGKKKDSFCVKQQSLDEMKTVAICLLSCVFSHSVKNEEKNESDQCTRDDGLLLFKTRCSSERIINQSPMANVE